MDAKKKTIIYAVVLVLLGFSLGVSFVKLRNRAVMKHWFDPTSRINFYMKNLTKRLDLDFNQASEVRNVLEKAHMENAALVKELSPRYEELRSRAFVEIEAVLNDEQREKFELIKERLNKMRRDRLNQRKRT